MRTAKGERLVSNLRYKAVPILAVASMAATVATVWAVPRDFVECATRPILLIIGCGSASVALAVWFFGFSGLTRSTRESLLSCS